MTACFARYVDSQALAAVGGKVRKAIASLFPVRPERRPGSLPALPPARKVIVIKPDPSRYGFVDRVKVPGCPWGDTAAFPAITDAVLAELDALRARAAGVLPPGLAGSVPGLFERLHQARAAKPGGAAWLIARASLSEEASDGS